VDYLSILVEKESSQKPSRQFHVVSTNTEETLTMLFFSHKKKSSNIFIDR